MNKDIYINDYGMTKWFWLVRYKEKFKMGKNVEIGSFSVFECDCGVEIQDNVKIGYGCVFVSDSTIDDKKGKIIVKKNAKVGSNSVIMPNVTIGENAVIGANSFVNKDIPKNEMWWGTPAIFVRKIK